MFWNVPFESMSALLLTSSVRRAGASLVVAICALSAPASAVTESSAPAAPSSAVDELDFSPGGPISDDALADFHVVIDCLVDEKPVGSLTLMMLPEKAPNTVRNFLRLAAAGFYDGSSFHRIQRNFAVEGGAPGKDGTGRGMFGEISGEFSDDPRYGHGYGVVSMVHFPADPESASCMFRVCCADGAEVWNLDGEYASFAEVVDGVDALEALANVKTLFDGREKTKPTLSVSMAKVRVAAGAPKSTERVVRPTPDLGGEPEVVTVQHVLLSFAGRAIGATRSQADAEKLAGDILARAQDGEDFQELVKKYSDDPPRGDNPGVYSVTNRGCIDYENERRQFEYSKKFLRIQESLEAQVRAGEINMAEYQRLLVAKRAEQVSEMGVGVLKRSEVAPFFGDTSFSLEVGEVGLAAFERTRSPFGWHIIKRLK